MGSAAICSQKNTQVPVVLEEELSLVEKVHARYEQAGFDGPAEFVAWMEQTYRMGINPIQAVKALMTGVCDVILAIHGDGRQYTASGPTILCWFDLAAQQFMLEIKE